MQLLNRNGLTCKIYMWRKSQAPTFKPGMTIKEKEDILNRKVYPNFRLGMYTAIGTYVNETEEKRMDDDKMSTMNILYNESKNAHKAR